MDNFPLQISVIDKLDRKQPWQYVNFLGECNIMKIKTENDQQAEDEEDRLVDEMTFGETADNFSINVCGYEMKNPQKPNSSWKEVFNLGSPFKRFTETSLRLALSSLFCEPQILERARQNKLTLMDFYFTVEVTLTNEKKNKKTKLIKIISQATAMENFAVNCICDLDHLATRSFAKHLLTHVGNAHLLDRLNIDRWPGSSHLSYQENKKTLGVCSAASDFTYSWERQKSSRLQPNPCSVDLWALDGSDAESKTKIHCCHHRASMRNYGTFWPKDLGDCCPLQ